MTEKLFTQKQIETESEAIMLKDQELICRNTQQVYLSLQVEMISAANVSLDTTREHISSASIAWKCPQVTSSAFRGEQMCSVIQTEQTLIPHLEKENEVFCYQSQNPSLNSESQKHQDVQNSKITGTKLMSGTTQKYLRSQSYDEKSEDSHEEIQMKSEQSDKHPSQEKNCDSINEPSEEQHNQIFAENPHFEIESSTLLSPTAFDSDVPPEIKTAPGSFGSENKTFKESSENSSNKKHENKLPIETKPGPEESSKDMFITKQESTASAIQEQPISAGCKVNKHLICDSATPFTTADSSVETIIGDKPDPSQNPYINDAITKENEPQQNQIFEENLQFGVDSSTFPTAFLSDVASEMTTLHRNLGLDNEFFKAGNEKQLKTIRENVIAEVNASGPVVSSEDQLFTEQEVLTIAVHEHPISADLMGSDHVLSDSTSLFSATGNAIETITSAVGLESQDHIVKEHGNREMMISICDPNKTQDNDKHPKERHLMKNIDDVTLLNEQHDKETNSALKKKKIGSTRRSQGRGHRREAEVTNSDWDTEDTLVEHEEDATKNKMNVEVVVDTQTCESLEPLHKQDQSIVMDEEDLNSVQISKNDNQSGEDIQKETQDTDKNNKCFTDSVEANKLEQNQIFAENPHFGIENEFSKAHEENQSNIICENVHPTETSDQLFKDQENAVAAMLEEPMSADTSGSEHLLYANATPITTDNAADTIISTDKLSASQNCPSSQDHTDKEHGISGMMLSICDTNRTKDNDKHLEDEHEVEAVSTERTTELQATDEGASEHFVEPDVDVKKCEEIGSIAVFTNQVNISSAIPDVDVIMIEKYTEDENPNAKNSECHLMKHRPVYEVHSVSDVDDHVAHSGESDFSEMKNIDDDVTLLNEQRHKESNSALKKKKIGSTRRSLGRGHRREAEVTNSDQDTEDTLVEHEEDATENKMTVEVVVDSQTCESLEPLHKQDQSIVMDEEDLNSVQTSENDNQSGEDAQKETQDTDKNNKCFTDSADANKSEQNQIFADNPHFGVLSSYGIENEISKAHEENQSNMICENVHPTETADQLFKVQDVTFSAMLEEPMSAETSGSEYVLYDSATPITTDNAAETIISTDKLPASQNCPSSQDHTDKEHGISGMMLSICDPNRAQSNDKHLEDEHEVEAVSTERTTELQATDEGASEHFVEPDVDMKKDNIFDDLKILNEQPHKETDPGVKNKKIGSTRRSLGRGHRREADVTNSEGDTDDTLVEHGGDANENKMTAHEENQSNIICENVHPTETLDQLCKDQENAVAAMLEEPMSADTSGSEHLLYANATPITTDNSAETIISTDKLPASQNCPSSQDHTDKEHGISGMVLSICDPNRAQDNDENLEDKHEGEAVSIERTTELQATDAAASEHFVEPDVDVKKGEEIGSIAVFTNQVNISSAIPDVDVIMIEKYTEDENPNAKNSEWHLLEQNRLVYEVHSVSDVDDHAAHSGVSDFSEMKNIDDDFTLLNEQRHKESNSALKKKKIGSTRRSLGRGHRREAEVTNSDQDTEDTLVEHEEDATENKMTVEVVVDSQTCESLEPLHKQDQSIVMDEEDLHSVQISKNDNQSGEDAQKETQDTDKNNKCFTDSVEANKSEQNQIFAENPHFGIENEFSKAHEENQSNIICENVHPTETSDQLFKDQENAVAAMLEEPMSADTSGSEHLLYANATPITTDNAADTIISTDKLSASQNCPSSQDHTDKEHGISGMMLSICDTNRTKDNDKHLEDEHEVEAVSTERTTELQATDEGASEHFVEPDVDMKKDNIFDDLKILNEQPHKETDPGVKNKKIGSTRRSLGRGHRREADVTNSEGDTDDTLVEHGGDANENKMTAHEENQSNIICENVHPTETSDQLFKDQENAVAAMLEEPMSADTSGSEHLLYANATPITTDNAADTIISTDKLSASQNCPSSQDHTDKEHGISGMMLSICDTNRTKDNDKHLEDEHEVEAVSTERTTELQATDEGASEHFVEPDIDVKKCEENGSIAVFTNQVNISSAIPDVEVIMIEKYTEDENPNAKNSEWHLLKQNRLVYEVHSISDVDDHAAHSGVSDFSEMKNIDDDVTLLNEQRHKESNSALKKKKIGSTRRSLGRGHRREAEVTNSDQDTEDTLVEHEEDATENKMTVEVVVDSQTCESLEPLHKQDQSIVMDEEDLNSVQTSENDNQSGEDAQKETQDTDKNNKCFTDSADANKSEQNQIFADNPHFGVLSSYGIENEISKAHEENQSNMICENVHPTETADQLFKVQDVTFSAMLEEPMSADTSGSEYVLYDSATPITTDNAAETIISTDKLPASQNCPSSQDHTDKEHGISGMMLSICDPNRAQSNDKHLEDEHEVEAVSTERTTELQATDEGASEHFVERDVDEKKDNIFDGLKILNEQPHKETDPGVKKKKIGSTRRSLGRGHRREADVTNSEGDTDDTLVEHGGDANENKMTAHEENQSNIICENVHPTETSDQLFKDQENAVAAMLEEPMSADTSGSEHLLYANATPITTDNAADTIISTDKLSASQNCPSSQDHTDKEHGISGMMLSICDTNRTKDNDKHLEDEHEVEAVSTERTTELQATDEGASEHFVEPDVDMKKDNIFDDLKILNEQPHKETDPGVKNKKIGSTRRSLGRGHRREADVTNSEGDTDDTLVEHGGDANENKMTAHEENQSNIICENVHPTETSDQLFKDQENAVAAMLEEPMSADTSGSEHLLYANATPITTDNAADTIISTDKLSASQNCPSSQDHTDKEHGISGMMLSICDTNRTKDNDKHLEDEHEVEAVSTERTTELQATDEGASEHFVEPDIDVKKCEENGSIAVFTNQVNISSAIPDVEVIMIEKYTEDENPNAKNSEWHLLKQNRLVYEVHSISDVDDHAAHSGVSDFSEMKNIDDDVTLLNEQRHKESNSALKKKKIGSTRRSLGRGHRREAEVTNSDQDTEDTLVEHEEDATENKMTVEVVVDSQTCESLEPLHKQDQSIVMDEEDLNSVQTSENDNQSGEDAQKETQDTDKNNKCFTDSADANKSEQNQIFADNPHFGVLSSYGIENEISKAHEENQSNMICENVHPTETADQLFKVQDVTFSAMLEEPMSADTSGSEYVLYDSATPITTDNAAETIISTDKLPASQNCPSSQDHTDKEHGISGMMLSICDPNRAQDNDENLEDEHEVKAVSTKKRTDAGGSEHFAEAEVDVKKGEIFLNEQCHKETNTDFKKKKMGSSRRSLGRGHRGEAEKSQRNSAIKLVEYQHDAPVNKMAEEDTIERQVSKSLELLNKSQATASMFPKEPDLDLTANDQCSGNVSEKLHDMLKYPSNLPEQQIKTIKLCEEIGMLSESHSFTTIEKQIPLSGMRKIVCFRGGQIYTEKTSMDENEHAAEKRPENEAVSQNPCGPLTGKFSALEGAGNQPPTAEQGLPLTVPLGQHGEKKEAESQSGYLSLTEEPVQFNVVMVGNSSVGKTSFIRQFQSGHFCEDLSATIGIDTCTQTMVVDNKLVKLQIWDTAGQERYHSITKQVLHKAEGLILMYDITSDESFYAVRKWISCIEDGAPTGVVMMLLGNKNDLSQRKVLPTHGQQIAQEFNISFMECSAATGNNVRQSLEDLARLLIPNVKENKKQHVTLHQEPQPKKSGCC
ncbi:uncharacterized protein rab44 isoform X1 [Denticeps clupeoides]|uniref:uncharacterized protein rab44 isoform X1 n=1 Tax=Denticeps clupeoides TaxID=299321 RepID=UPI0010A32733|nr:uncharacterized protein LOC114768425 isoform X1 [Denticeps clupeoides]